VSVLRPVDRPPASELVALRTIDDAVALLDQWVTAYRRLEHQYAKVHQLNETNELLAESWQLLAEIWQRDLERLERLEKVPF
jgi:hypothetical protein